MIPKIVHYTFATNKLPIEIIANIEHNKKMCPDYKFIFYNDADCDLFIKTIETIQEIEFQDSDEEIAQGICCASFKCDNDRIHKILSPVSGRIVEVNERIKNNPNLIEKDPYFEGWIYRVIPANLDYEIKYLIPCSSDRI
jgi:glycine cleavage system H lipoate-binding protein